MLAQKQEALGEVPQRKRSECGKGDIRKTKKERRSSCGIKEKECARRLSQHSLRQILSLICGKNRVSTQNVRKIKSSKHIESSYCELIADCSDGRKKGSYEYINIHLVTEYLASRVTTTCGTLLACNFPITSHAYSSLIHSKCGRDICTPSLIHSYCFTEEKRRSGKRSCEWFNQTNFIGK